MLLSVRWYERVRRHYRVTLRRARLCTRSARSTCAPATCSASPPRSSSSRTRTTCSSIPRSSRWSAWACPRTTPSAMCRCGASGSSRTRCAWSAYANTGPATARAGCTGKPPRARQGRRLQVKLLEPTTTHRLHVLLNVSTSARTGRGRATTRRCSRRRSPRPRRSRTGQRNRASWSGCRRMPSCSTRAPRCACRPAATRAS